MNKGESKHMKKQVIKLKLFIVFLMMILTGLLALVVYVGVQLVRANMSNETKETCVLGVNNRVGTIGVEMHYDKEPVPIEITSPSGKRYSHSEVDEENKNIRVTTVSSEKGEWKLTYAQKHNKALSYKMIIEPSDELIMDTDLAKAYIKDNFIVIECEPVYKEPTDTDIDVETTFSINVDGGFYVLDTRLIKANTLAVEEFEITERAREIINEDSDSRITVTIATQNPNDFQDKSMSSSNRIQLDLNPSTKEIKNADEATETSAENTTEQETQESE